MPLQNTTEADFEAAKARQLRRRTILGYGGAIAIFIALIEIGHASLPPYLFPSAWEIAVNGFKALRVNYDDLLITLARLAVALLSATLLGWFLGLVMGAFRRSIGLVALPGLTIMQAIPALSLVLVASLWISNPEIRVWLICFALGVPLYAISVYEGIRDLDGDLIEAVDQFRPTKWQVIYILLIPQSFVHLLISLRSVSSLILRILVFAELIGASTGVGAKMGEAQTNFDIATIFSWTAIMVILNFGLLWIIDLVEARLLSWRREVAIR